MFSVRKEVVEASKDYKYLLSRGYRQKVVLDLVTSRYGLSIIERILLLRCVHSSQDVEVIRSKCVKDVKQYPLIIDGYNVLLTLHTVMEGMEVFLCDDGFIRDLRKSYRKGIDLKTLEDTIELLKKELLDLTPSSVTIVLDKNVSYSAHHADKIKNFMRDLAEVVLADKADMRVIGGDGIIASSDYVVISRARKIYDLAGEIIKKNFKDKIIDLTTLIPFQTTYS
ncbi:MAG: DUF434 domain-containing protein [Desulfurococcaceae archaeon TW002]